METKTKTDLIRNLILSIQASSNQPSDYTTSRSISSSLPNDYIGIPFKNVSNEQATNRNYLDNNQDRSSDELLSRSVDGDVVRTSSNGKQKSHLTNDKSANDDYITESSLHEKPTDSSIFYDNNNDKSEVVNKHKSNGNKINLDIEPQPPNYAGKCLDQKII